MGRTFGPRYRLHRRREFDQVFAAARRRVRAHPFTVLSRPNELGYPRIGLVVGKRHARRAVDRNRIKRIIRDSFRSWLPRLPAHDIVVLSGRGVVECDNVAMFEALESAWIKLIRLSQS